MNPNAGVILEDLVLASTHCWMNKGTRPIVHANIKRGFSVEIIRAATVKLTEVGHVFVERRGSNIRPKVDMFIDNILNTLYNLEEKGHMPKIIVNSVDLCGMPLYAVAEGDTVEVSTRLGSI